MDLTRQTYFTVTVEGGGDPVSVPVGPEPAWVEVTVTGKVVREILQNELGPIRIGNNLTDYAWDGKDEYGDQLAKGVYVYRVKVRGTDNVGQQVTAESDFEKLVILK